MGLRQDGCRFVGPLNLEGNSTLTDLSALYISEVLKRSDHENTKITALNLTKTLLQDKAGIFIGDALLGNPAYPLKKLKFKDVNLEETGLYRLLEAANSNANIEKMHLGFVSDYGLKAMAELLKTNTSLLKLEFEEN